MNLWQRLTLGTKMLFGGFEEAIEYLLGFLNQYLALDGVKDKVEAAYKTIRWCANKLSAYYWLCPAKWKNDYKRVMDCAFQIADVFQDGKFTVEEIEKCRARFAEVYENWEKED